MSIKNTVLIRTDQRFKELFIEDIKVQRQKFFPKERLKPVSSARITLASVRHPLMERIKKDIIKTSLK